MHAIHEYPFEPRRVMVNGHTLSVVDEGEGMPIVLLHGNPSWSYLYRRVISAFRGQYRMIAPDHIGCGLSDKPQAYPYRLADHIDNLIVLLDKLKIKRCLLMVHDWGGAIGMGWAGRYPDRVAGLVVMNTAAFPAPLPSWRIGSCRIPFFSDLFVRGLNGFVLAATRMGVTTPMTPEVAAGFSYPYDSWANRIAIHRFVQDIPLSLKDGSWQDLLAIEANFEKLLDVPMLVCWGGRDFCFTESFYREWRTRFPNSEGCYVADAGHYLLEDGWETIQPRLAHFFAAQEKYWPVDAASE